MARGVVSSWVPKINNGVVRAPNKWFQFVRFAHPTPPAAALRRVRSKWQEGLSQVGCQKLTMELKGHLTKKSSRPPSAAADFGVMRKQATMCIAIKFKQL